MQPAPSKVVSPPTLTISHAEPQDYAAMREVIRAAYAQYADELGKPLFGHYLADLLDLDKHARMGQLLVARYDAAVVGTAAFYPDISAQDVGWPRGWAGGRALSVHPAARGLGVAQALVTHAEGLARDAGARFFALHTAELMTDAISLYEHLGYERAPEYDTDLSFFFKGADGHPVKAIAFKRELWSPRGGVPGRRTRVRGSSTAPAYYYARPRWWLKKRFEARA